MTQRTPESALKAYRTVTDKLDAARAEYTAKIAEMVNVKAKIESWLLENVQDHETPEWLFDVNPSLNWAIGKKTDENAIRTHMKIDDGLAVELKNQYEESKKVYDECLSSIEKWGLEQMLKRGSKGFKSDEGTAHLRTDTRYQISDKVLLIQDALKNGYGSELTITMRANSKFAGKYVEDNGELMPGVSSFREQKCIIGKG